MTRAKSMLKKVMGTVLAAAMTMSLSVSVFAATPATIKVTFNDNEQPEVSATVSTQPLIDTGTYFQGEVLEKILNSSKLVEGEPFVMKYGDQATLLDVINKAAISVQANPVYEATNQYTPNGIYIDSLFGKGTVNNYIDNDGDGKADEWQGSYWNIKYSDENGAPYDAAYYANNELLENTPVTDINFTYETTTMPID